MYRTGDVIAFSHDSTIGKVIQRATNSFVTHVALVLDMDIVSPDVKYVVPVILVIEADIDGVVFNFLSSRILNEYNTIWHLPLSDDSRNKLNLKALRNFLTTVIHKEYDFKQVITSALDRWSIHYNEESFEKFFCSELVAALLEKSGVIPEVNASEVTPINICQWNIYGKYYTKLLGSRDIRGYNTLPVESE